MEIGERVRFLHSKEEGIIRRIIDKRTLEIEIDEGFLVPVLKNEVVRIAGEEHERFQKETEDTSTVQTAGHIKEEDIRPDVLIALEITGTKLDIWLINSTPDRLLFAVHGQYRDRLSGLSEGKLNKHTYAKIDTWNMENRDNWPILCTDIIFFIKEGEHHKPVVSRKINIGKNHLLKKSIPTPLLNKKAIQISLIVEKDIPDPEKLKEALFVSKGIEGKDPSQKNKTDESIDLHAEALIKDPSGLSRSEILDLQLDHFLKKLDEAVIHNHNSITFIHGVGNGTLRHLIHKNLGQYPHIRYFEDAMKEKFGFGATKVYLK